MWNRDKLGARNIGTQFQRLFNNQGPLKTLTTEELEFHSLNVCLECARFAARRAMCGLLQNRDKTGATNIGLQFQKLMCGEPPIRAMSDEELEFHRLNACLECHDS